MKKIFYFMATLIAFLSFSVYVRADYGDLLYNVDSVTVTDNGINIRGYSLIHRTNNYVTIYKRREQTSGNYNTVDHSTIIKSGGGQTTYILATNCADYDVDPTGCKTFEIAYSADPYEADLNGQAIAKDYNFYYQHFIRDYSLYTVDTYNDYNMQKCAGEYTDCYYEDIGFNITFSIDDLISKFGNDDKLYFYIASYNNHYRRKTNYKSLAISGISGSSDYIDVSATNITGKVHFIAGMAKWQKEEGGKFKEYFWGCTKPKSPTSSFGQNSWCGSNYEDNVNKSLYYMMEDDYDNLLKSTTNDNKKGKTFLNGTVSPGTYGFCVNTSDPNHGTNACSNLDLDENDFCIDCSAANAKVLYAFSSWIEVHGDNQLTIKVKNPNLCEVTDPDKDSGLLECNQGKTYNSTCEKLTVTTDKGNAVVKIEQNGNVTSVLTPDSIYAGGGFNLGIMYYNTIKWSYVPGQNINNELHSAVTNAMNRKIKDYESFVAGINISNMQMGGKAFNLTKQCTTSNRNKDYYNKELTVSCVFTIPKSDIDLIGNVSYDYNSGIDINNKYYTPLNYEGKYKITADITGMDRITESASVSDSKENGRRWTGNWSDTFTNCEIDVYGLLMKNNSYNFIYRPIDIFNPFPNRNAGINWFDWYNITRNKERLENTYSNSSQYKSILDNKAINDIKNYNNSYDYLGWDSIDKDTYESSFITDNDYIVRGGH